MRSSAAIAILLPFLLTAQVPVALLDTAKIRIGEQAQLTLMIDLSGEQLSTSIGWPTLPDTIGKVEIVRIGGIDTAKVSTGTPADRIQLSQRLKITSFDTGFWAIPPFIFQVEGQNYETAPLLLEVQGIELGENAELRDIKPIHEVPFNPMHWLQKNWIWLFAALVLIAIIWWFVRWMIRRPVRSPEPIKAAPVIPLHERILKDLRDLESERSWQNGEHKRYHSRLTDLLRMYIEERYEVPAMESTTDELIKELRVNAIDREQLERLRNMLELSDMVKFAKTVPAPIENEQIMQNAIRFVQATAALKQEQIHA